mmetsp:Transcript_76917/g.135518  ORF Transcript_76917/g.135518 Transcript_76917/m.135518 type:complete len:163 (+) Transcript_76917:58-546(+)
MAKSTVYWSPAEASLSRASLNKMLQPGEKLDVTEAMMKAATIGRKAEMGNSWEPPGMVSRARAAALLTKSASGGSSPQELAPYAALLREGSQQDGDSRMAPSMGSRPRSVSNMQGSASNWSAMLPPKKPESRENGFRKASGPISAAALVVRPNTGSKLGGKE